MKQIYRLELEEARAMVRAAIARSEQIGVLESVCIVDDGGYPIALERMDGARITGPQIAWNKAFTASGHKRSTHLFTTPPNGPALPTMRPSASSGASRASSPHSWAAFPSWSTTRSSAASA